MSDDYKPKRSGFCFWYYFLKYIPNTRRKTGVIEKFKKNSGRMEKKKPKGFSIQKEGMKTYLEGGEKW